MTEEKKYYERVTPAEAAKNGVTFISTGKVTVSDEKAKLEMISSEHFKEIKPLLILFAIRNKKGEWYRSKVMDGHSNNWTEDLDKARIYTKLGPARSVRTKWHKKYPELGKFDVIALKVAELTVLDFK